MRFSVPEALVRCVSRGLFATNREIDALARRIWAESAPSRTAFAWSCLEDGSPERQKALRAATIALNGYAT